MATPADDDNDAVKLLSFWASPYAMRAQLALAAKRIPYTSLPQEIGYNSNSSKSPLLLQHNPVHKQVPVLLHKGKPISESLIIVEYLDEAFPSPLGINLLPTDPYHKAMARFWADFCEKKVFETLLKIVRRPKVEHEEAMEESKHYLRVLEGAFATELPFFSGCHMGFVDIVLGPLVVVLPALEEVGGFKLDFDKLPRLYAWMKAFRKSPLLECLPQASNLIEHSKRLRKERFPHE